MTSQMSHLSGEKNKSNINTDITKPRYLIKWPVWTNFILFGGITHGFPDYNIHRDSMNCLPNGNMTIV